MVNAGKTITGQTSWTLVINMHHSPYTFSFEFKFASIFVSQNLLLKIRNICDSDLVWIPLFHYILTADKWLYGKFRKQTNLIQNNSSCIFCIRFICIFASNFLSIKSSSTYRKYTPSDLQSVQTRNLYR